MPLANAVETRKSCNSLLFFTAFHCRKETGSWSLVVTKKVSRGPTFIAYILALTISISGCVWWSLLEAVKNAHCWMYMLSVLWSKLGWGRWLTDREQLGLCTAQGIRYKSSQPASLSQNSAGNFLLKKCALVHCYFMTYFNNLRSNRHTIWFGRFINLI